MMPSSLIGLVLFFSMVKCDRPQTENKTENVWKTAGRLTGSFFQQCMQLSSDAPQEQFLLIFQQCLKRRSLLALDKSLKSDIIKLAAGIELVRYRNISHANRELRIFQDKHDWKTKVLARISELLHTHVLKIKLNVGKDSSKSLKDEGRGRKKDHMTSMLMFGIAAVGLIMVPMGFQFLAVLGGKALLLAKMALILTAIQGLKKIATSNINYGLYATPEHQCKDDFCRSESLEADDSVFVAIDVDQPAQLENDPVWHYDRQWPYDAESYDVAQTYGNYRQIAPEHSDLLHPLQPRLDPYKKLNY